MAGEPWPTSHEDVGRQLRDYANAWGTVIRDEIYSVYGPCEPTLGDQVDLEKEGTCLFNVVLTEIEPPPGSKQFRILASGTSIVRQTPNRLGRKFQET